MDLFEKHCSRIITSVILLCLSGLSGYGQSAPVDPFDGRSSLFHAKPERYFISRDVEAGARKKLMDSVSAFRNDTVIQLSHLKEYLDQFERLLISLNRHYQYHRLAGYLNNKDSTSRSGARAVGDTISVLTTLVNEVLQKPGMANLSDAQLKRSGISKYAFLIRLAGEREKHSLSVHDETLIAKAFNPALDRLTDRYDELMDNIKAEDILTPEQKKLNPIEDRSVIYNNKDATVREAGSKGYHNAYGLHGEVMAATLIDITAQQNVLAKLRGYTGALEKTYARRLQLSVASVKQLLQQMTLHADVLKGFQRVKVQQVKQITGLTTAHSWDMAQSTGFVWKPLPYVKTSQLILKALSPLGKEYNEYFAWLLDPANGALEIAGGPNRVNENTSIGYPGVPTSLYMKSYGGSLGDVLRLSHEGGHAIHGQMMSDHHIVPSYAAGPGFLSEAYAMLNELLLLDELQRQSATAEGQAYFTKQFLDKLSLEVFTSAQEGTFEHALYEGVDQGKIKTREDIDSLYAGIMNQYDLFFADEPHRRSEWINKRLLFDDPLYNINYLYAILVTCKLYTMSHEDPKGFSTRYSELLKNGFDAPAEDLLKKYMGFSLDNEVLLNSTLQIMRDKTALLQKLYGLK